MRTLLRYLGYFGFFALLGCGADTAAIAVIAAATAGSAVASTAETGNEEDDNDDLKNFDGIYHLSAIAVDNALVTCPSSFTGWFEADGQTREITRGFFLFMDCNTQSLDRIEIDGDFFFEDIDNDVCSQGGCLRLELNVSGTLGQATRIWRGFLVRGGKGFVFAQVDPFNGSALAGSAWRTFREPPDPNEDMLNTPEDATDT